MESLPSRPALLSYLLHECRMLESCLRQMAATPARVLEAGQGLLEFARMEDAAFSALAHLLDPAVLHEMSVEHETISQDLELLEWLIATTPDSPDADTLAESLARRMLAHISRDGRLLARALRLSDAAPSE